MKKFLGFLLITMLAVASVFGLFACDKTGDGDTTPGIKMYLVDSVDNPYYVVSDYVCDGQTTKLEIPAENNGYPVKEIKSNAFSGNDVLTEIVVPTSVETINEGAFSGVKKLAKLTIPFVGKTANSDAYINETDEATDKSVGVQRTLAFVFGTESFNYGVSVTAKYSEADADTKTYYMPVSLKEIVIAPKEAYSIPMYAFCGNTVINKITFAGDIDKIGDYAFSGCEMLNEVVVQDTVSYIGKYAFNNAKSLADGLTFEDSSLALTIGEYAFYGAGIKNLTVPARTTSFGEFAFSASALETVNLSTQKIANYAFKDCTGLKSVVISDATTKVGVYAFDGCKALESFGKTVSAGKIDLTGIDSLGAMSFARLNPNATYTVVSTLDSAILNYAFFNTNRA